MNEIKNKINFTPGPWFHDKYHSQYKENEYNCVAKDPRFPPDGFSFTGLFNDATARLIAAAPEMYELLRKGLEDGEPMNWDKVSELLDKIN